MYDELTPLLSDQAVVHASVDDLLNVTDLPERNVTIRRWHKNGKPLTIRVRPLDLDQWDAVNQAALIKNAKTGIWEQSAAALNAAVLFEAVVTPKLTKEQAQSMRKHNPVIIEKLVLFITGLSALDDDTIERHARVLANPETAAAEATGDPSGE